MVKEKDLVVGNWFHHHVGLWSYRNDDGVISNFDDNFQWENSDWYALGECTLSLEAIEPIKLTDEWLDRFKLDKGNGYPYRFLNGYLKMRNGVYFFKYYDIEVELPYVHDLQNLYRSITGNEFDGVA